MKTSLTTVNSIARKSYYQGKILNIEKERPQKSLRKESQLNGTATVHSRLITNPRLLGRNSWLRISGSPNYTMLRDSSLITIALCRLTCARSSGP